MSDRLFIDTETFSPIKITNGSYKYSEGAEVMIVTYAFNDEPVQLWDRTLNPETTTPAMPVDLREALADPEIEIVGHNIGGFDRVVIEKDLKILIPSERTHDTFARAYAHNLPGSLDTLCSIFNVPVTKAKDKAGKKLIQLFCKPRLDGTRATQYTHPDEWAHFCDYAKLDIEAMRYIDAHMPNWNYVGFEKNLWNLDQKINKRGFAIDTDLIDAVIQAVDEAQVGHRERVVELTAGEVSSATRRDLLLKHVLETYDVALPDMQAATIERRVEDPKLPEGLRELLKIRLMACTSSTAKYQKIRASVSADGRLRGTIQWCGAGHTGRDAGRILNPQNLPRPTMKQEDIDFGIRAFKAGCADLFFENVMGLASNTLRGVIVAAPKKKIIAADYKNIEGRYAAWLAGEEWKLQAFREYDAGTGADLYALAYARMFKVTAESVMADKKAGGNQRQVGKTAELALGFQGGVGSFVTFATAFNIDPQDLADKARETIPADIREEAMGFWGWAVSEKRTLGLERDVFVACDALKRLWRNAHPNFVWLWAQLETQVREAIETKGTTFKIGKRLAVRRDGNWLRILMPSGRSLSYPAPRVDDKGQISFMGMDQYSRQWKRIKTYGGKLFNNPVQGGARDVFMYGLVNAERAGYETVLRVHDELVTEVPDTDRYTLEGLCTAMTTGIDWVDDLPLSAGGYEAYRYRKDE